MKKLLLSIGAITAFSASVNAQVIAKVLEPADIAGNKQMSWGETATWGNTPDFNIAGTFIVDTLALAIDNSAASGNNPLGGHAYIYEGCNAFSNASAVAGKIAVVYRGSCEFGKKAFNAQNAGAIGVIILNRDQEVIAMGAGADGPNVTIPVVMLNTSDGVAIRQKLDANIDVIALLGNKQNANQNDLGFLSEGALPPPFSTISSAYQTINFAPFLEVFNYGSDNQASCTANAKIVGPGSSTVYDQTVTYSLNSGDNNFIATGNAQEFPEWAPTSPAIGDYTLTYTVSPGASDEDESDNTITYNFTITDNKISLAPSTGGTMISNSYPSNSGGIYRACMTLDLPSTFPSNSGITKFSFYPEADTAVYKDLAGTNILLNVYEWSDTSGVDGFITQVGSSVETLLPSQSSTRQLHSHTMSFAESIPLVGDQLYLVCLETSAGTDISFGYDNKTDYSLYTRAGIKYAGPILVNQNGTDTWFRGAWSGVSALSLAIELDELSSISENNELVASVFPNPANDVVNVRMNATGNVTIVATDVSGKTVINKTTVLTNNTASVSTENLEPGMYIFTINTEAGQSTKVNVVKK